MTHVTPVLVLSCAALVGCQAAGAPQLPGAAEVSAFSPVSAVLPDLVRDATRLDQPSGDERFDALIALLRARDLPFEIQPFIAGEGERRVEGRNVVIDVGSGDRDLIVGAHADAAVLDDGSLSHAMVDNAAAVVVLTRVVEALGQYPLRHRVRVVFVDKEEVGLVGSRRLVASVDPERVAGMVNLDITGYGDTVIYGPASSPGNEQLHAGVRLVCAQAEHACLEFPQFPPGDDRSFQAAGIPNVSLATLPRLEAHQLWLALNGGESAGLQDDFVPAIMRTIHTPRDTVARLDPAGMTLAYDTVLRLVLQLDRVLD
jgi:hypothetical protein